MYRSPSAGFQMQFPSRWHFTPVQTSCGTADFSGAFVSNAPHGVVVPAGSSDACWPPDSGGLPADGVVVGFDLFQGGGPDLDLTLLPDTPLPLQTTDLRLGPDDLWRAESVTFHHLSRYAVLLRSGAALATADRRIADRVIASIRPWNPPRPPARFGECVGGWDREPVPVGPLEAQVRGVDSLAPTDVWAVGRYRHVLIGTPTPSPAIQPGPATATTGLALHWDGHRWRRVEADPDLTVGSNGIVYGASSFRDVAEISPHDVWAVGSDGEYGLTEHWDGSQWTVVPSPKINFVDSALLAVAGTGPHDAWAVASGGSGQSAVVEHWDGHRWIVSPLPDLPSRYSSADDVSAFSPADAWVVGQSLAVHWDGTAWRVVPTPPARWSWLSGVVDLGPTDAWAVGTSYRDVDGRGPVYPLVEHWDGVRWTLASLPSLPSHVSLSKVSAAAPNDVWAVGWGQESDDTETQVVLHFDGTTWSDVSPPAPTLEQGSFGAVAATEAGAWMVGSDGTETVYRPDRPFVVRSCS